MRKITVSLVAALVFAACSGSQEVYEMPPGAPGAAGRSADGDLILPEPVPAAPAYAVETRRAISPAKLRRLAGVDGVAVVAPVRTRRVRVKGPKGWRRMRVGAVESLRFRSVAPPAMRDANFVWLSLVTGDAVPTFAAADRLGLRPGDAVKVSGVGTVAVGAWADNAPHAVADVLLDEQHLERLRPGAPRTVLVGAETGVTLQVLAKDLRKVLPGGRLRRLVPRPQARPAPAPRAATTTTSTSASITGLHPALAAAVQRLLEAAGGRVWIVSGFRSTAHQQVLWQAALERYKEPEVADNWVAPPGSSYHEVGLAVDLGGDLELAAALIERLGLPLWRPMSWEPWHFELLGSRG